MVRATEESTELWASAAYSSRTQRERMPEVTLPFVGVTPALHYGARTYFPEIGRFGQRDRGANAAWQIEFAYEYAGLQPTDATDPTGLTHKFVAAAAKGTKGPWWVVIHHNLPGLTVDWKWIEKTLTGAGFGVSQITHRLGSGLDPFAPLDPRLGTKAQNGVYASIWAGGAVSWHVYIQTAAPRSLGKEVLGVTSIVTGVSEIDTAEIGKWVSNPAKVPWAAAPGTAAYKLMFDTLVSVVIAHELAHQMGVWPEHGTDLKADLMRENAVAEWTLPVGRPSLQAPERQKISKHMDETD